MRRANLVGELRDASNVEDRLDALQGAPDARLEGRFLERGADGLHERREE